MTIVFLTFLCLRKGGGCWQWLIVYEKVKGGISDTCSELANVSGFLFHSPQSQHFYINSEAAYLGVPENTRLAPLFLGLQKPLSIAILHPL